MSAVKINKFGKFDLNPRGNLWLKDENRFGHKLLSKMGWSQGKGLGKNENGIAENLKVKMKSGNTGVGWSEKVPLEAEHKEYDAVLANLNEKFNSENNTEKGEDVKSLELRSQQFKKRLHYGKFVRGKDVCRYSEKDMNSIFVMKKAKPEPTPVKSTVTNIESSSIEDEAPEATPTFKSRLSMNDYFEMKMKQKMGNALSNNDVTDIKFEKDTSLGEISSKKKNKNKKLDLQTSEESSSESSMSISNDVIEVKTEDDTRHKEISIKKKSKNKKTQLDLQTSEESSSDGHQMDCIVKKETDTAGSSTDKKSPRKSKTKKVEKSNGLKLDAEILDVSSDEEEVPQNCNSCPEELSVKKETSSRKRSKSASTEKSKRIKLDPDIVNEYSSTNSNTSEESDVMEVSHCENESPKTQITTSNGLVSKVSEKRKKKNALKKAEKRKRAGTDVVDISEESTSPESSEKELQEDLVLLGEFPESEVQVLSKKGKKAAVAKSKKSKSGALTKLKTCLKGSTNYWLEKKSRKVSFNEHVFYRTIKSDAEKTDDENELANESDVSKSAVCHETVKESLDKDANEAGSSDVKNGLCNGESAQFSDEGKPDELNNGESEEVPSCMKLPKVDKSNYNSWLENQRLATKMKLYQNMIKKIKKHPVLKTSNILDLKGYGNWGY